uniref:Uncharacterized protein n=1 Tax=Poecilia reticulata TaxID=8081 RepID=A0A3P9P911_POERE
FFFFLPYREEFLSKFGMSMESPHKDIQHTIVNVPTEPSADYLVWSLWNFVYGNFFCLGLVALSYSVKARDRKMVGDQDGARRHAYTAHVLNVFVTSLAILLSIAALIVVIYTSFITNIKHGKYVSLNI